jgi:hypothetical protein
MKELGFNENLRFDQITAFVCENFGKIESRSQESGQARILSIKLRFYL